MNLIPIPKVRYDPGRLDLKYAVTRNNLIPILECSGKWICDSKVATCRPTDRFATTRNPTTLMGLG